MKFKSKTLNFLSAILIVTVSFHSCKEDDFVDNPVAENSVLSGTISANRTLFADTIYELAGKVVIEDGATLTINPGTILKGRTGSGSLASALVVARGGKINAEGTSEKPIIFTSALDNIKVGEKTGTNLSETDREKWGGVVILGRAPISASSADIEAQIEGIPADEEFGKYGGNNLNDNSGVLKFVSIRHGGALIGEGNEINGLTLGGVGSGTVIENIEVIGNLDDGIEFFGGTVNATNLLVAFQGDDALDIDQNYSGTIANAYVLHGADTDNALEIDGPEGSTYTDGAFTMTNSTFVSSDGEGKAGTFKDKAQGEVNNCLFSGYNSWIRVRANFDGSGSDKADAYLYMVTSPEKLIFTNNQFETLGSDVMNVYTDNTTYTVSQAMQDNAEAKFSLTNQLLAPNTGTVGADLSKFTGWTWMSIKGKL